MNAFIKTSKFHQKFKIQRPGKFIYTRKKINELPQNNLSQINKVKTFILKTKIPTKEIKKTLKRGKLTVFTL